MANHYCPNCGSELVEVEGSEGLLECPYGCDRSPNATDIPLARGCGKYYDLDKTHEEGAKESENS
ncbi:MAG: hypothetical protein GX345_01870 [Clostridiales bacterium]|nr:hypothetical protein [Clostridiales bacterium]